MAPFNTHLLIAEKIWPDLADGPWREHYGQFCFGCVAPDVDKASQTLTQKDTHFFDRTNDYELMASARTAAFLARQGDFLKQPFSAMSAAEQAFVLGYLCHLCVDEVSKHMWRRETWQNFWPLRPTSAFAALDEVAWQQTEDYQAIREALAGLEAPDVIAPIPLADLQKMLRGVQAFAAAKSAVGEYTALLDLFMEATAHKREEYLECFRGELDTARQRVHAFQLETCVRAGVVHTQKRVAALLAGRRPQPDYPSL